MVEGKVVSGIGEVTIRMTHFHIYHDVLKSVMDALKGWDPIEILIPIEPPKPKAKEVLIRVEVLP